MADDNANLSSIADYYASQGMSNPQLTYDINGNPIYQSSGNNPLPVDVSNLQDYAATLPSPAPNPLPTHNPYVQTSAEKVASILTGGNGQERYQLFPERIARSALSLPTDVMSGKVRTPSNPPPTGSEEDYSSDELLQRVQDMAALMGGGGFGMAEKGALGSVGGKVIQPIAEAVKDVAPVFHSAVENAVNTASLKSAPPQQWLSTIANSKGVKPEELDWTGLKDWLGEQQGPVSKEQIQQHLEQNKVELKEVNKGDYTKTSDLRSLFEIHNPKPNNTNIKTEFGEKLNPEYEQWLKDRDIFIGQNIAPTKYSKYVLPGAENYREKLLTLPNKIADMNEARAKEIYTNVFQKNGKSWEELSPFNQVEWIAKLQQQEPPLRYKSSHWDEPNILAHIRMNDRTIEGKKALHIEEIQSDWHQQGREQGYKITDAQKKQLEQIDNKLTTKLSEGDIGNPDMDAVLKTAVDKKVITSQEAANYKQWSKGENSNIPDAPFKKTWLDLAAKRMIREAAEQGKDVLSWTPGEAQAARYDLSKHIKEISHIRNSRTIETGYKGEHTYDIAATTHSGGDVNIPNAGKMTERDLENTFGKEIAKKIVNDEGVKYRGREFKTLEGLDLKVGGEGMHYFYDKMLPAVLEKLTGQKMKFGNVPKDIREYRIEPGPASDRNGNTVTVYSVRDNQNRLLSDFRNEADAKQYIAGRKAGEAEQKAPKINYIDLPQSVKNTALHKGFPLFSSGLMLSPTDDNPFKRYKLTEVEGNPFEAKK